jgi:hypothetical protein
MQLFCNKRNVILEVDDKSIVMLFKKGLMDSSLICKLTVKNPRTLEVMFTITNKYALFEEATLNTREQKELAHPRATTRRGKSNVLLMWWNGHSATRSTGPGRVNLKAS